MGDAVAMNLGQTGSLRKDWIHCLTEEDQKVKEEGRKERKNRKDPPRPYRQFEEG
jgi:hypothetical protein